MNKLARTRAALGYDRRLEITKSPARTPAKAAPESAVLDQAPVATTLRDGQAGPTPQARREGEDHRAPPNTNLAPCALGSCGKLFIPKPVRRGRDPALYCSQDCRAAARRQKARGRGTIRHAQDMSAYWASRREVEAPPEPRQAPLAPPRFTLTWDSRVVIAPDRPALPRRYENGAPALFRDDLNAMADHGSPGHLPRADDAWRSPSASALAQVI
jgi:hypothetical protein